MLTTVNSVIIKNGRKTGGTVIDKDVCAECWKRGIWTPMLPALPKLVTPKKPRRTKPKLIK